MKACVVHLAWGGADHAHLDRFLSAYADHPAGCEHRLVIAWNGYPDAGALADGQRRAAGIEHDDFVVAGVTLDLTVYRQVAAWASEPVICFLNSYSRILVDRWLGLMAGHLASPDVGLVGATGSWESPLSGAPLPLRLLRAGRYPPFPNPHIRTNAFMLERETLLSLDWPAVVRKADAYELESGHQSVTRQIQARGLAAVVAGRDGQAYPPDRWNESRTFRAQGQENLIVEDNRTRQYAAAAGRRRRRLARLAWGQRLA